MGTLLQGMHRQYWPEAREFYSGFSETWIDVCRGVERRAHAQHEWVLKLVILFLTRLCLSVFRFSWGTSESLK